MKVKVHASTSGFIPITVQFYENEVMMECNHAGHYEETIELTTPVWEDDVNMFVNTGSEDLKAEVCDKCNAWSEDRKEWYE